MTERRPSLAPYEDPYAFMDEPFKPVVHNPFQHNPDVAKQIFKDERADTIPVETVETLDRPAGSHVILDLGTQSISAFQAEMKRDRAKLRAPLK